MKLIHMKAPEVCPICGSPVVKEWIETNIEGQIRLHSCGHRWEHREYACGCHIEYVPNFNHDEITKICPNEKKEREKRKKRQQAYKTLLEVVRSLDVDKEFKEAVRIPNFGEWRGFP